MRGGRAGAGQRGGPEPGRGRPSRAPRAARAPGLPAGLPPPPLRARPPPSPPLQPLCRLGGPPNPAWAPVGRPMATGPGGLGATAIGLGDRAAALSRAARPSPEPGWRISWTTRNRGTTSRTWSRVSAHPVTPRERPRPSSIVGDRARLCPLGQLEPGGPHSGGCVLGRGCCPARSGPAKKNRRGASSPPIHTHQRSGVHSPPPALSITPSLMQPWHCPKRPRKAFGGLKAVSWFCSYARVEAGCRKRTPYSKANAFPSLPGCLH